LVENLRRGRTAAGSGVSVAETGDGVASRESRKSAEDDFVDVGSLATGVTRIVKIENFAVFDHA
jgi:hypothetical protein